VSDDLNFHYDRDERLSMRSAPQPRSSGGGFARRRRLPFLFVLVLISILVILQRHPSVRAAYRAELAGCQVTLNALAAGDDVIVTLEVKGGASVAAGERLFAVFRAGEAEIRLSEVLPAARRTVTLDGRIIGAGAVREVVVEVSAGGKSAVLRRALERG
jgi:hypothetical protein